ncbi:MAG: hypothetical protein ACE367_02305 [Acidimicrobiales bacterium]
MPESTEKQVAGDVGAVIRHPPRPIVRQLRRVLPVLGDLPSPAIALRGVPFFAVPPCPEVRPAGPTPRAKVARSFFIEPDQAGGSQVAPSVLVTQVLAYRTPGQASEALAAWFQETAIDCPRYRSDEFYGAELEGGLTLVVTNQPTDAPVRLGQEQRAIRTRAVIRGKALRVEVTDGVGVVYRHGRYLLFVESAGMFGSEPAGPRPDFRLLGTIAEAMFDRIEELPGPVG